MSRTRRRLGLACTTWGSPADVSRCKKLEVIQLLTVRLEFCTSPRCSTSGAVLTCDTSLLPRRMQHVVVGGSQAKGKRVLPRFPSPTVQGCCDDGQVIRVMHTYQDLREVVGCPTALLSTLAMPMSHKRADERHRDRSSPTLWVHVPRSNVTSRSPPSRLRVRRNEPRVGLQSALIYGGSLGRPECRSMNG